MTETNHGKPFSIREQPVLFHHVGKKILYPLRELTKVQVNQGIDALDVAFQWLFRELTKAAGQEMIEIKIGHYRRVLFIVRTETCLSFGYHRMGIGIGVDEAVQADAPCYSRRV